MTLLLTAAMRGLVLLSLSGAPGLALSATSCGQAAEQDALSARALQTDLMVSALVCNRRADYNAFVTRFRGPLSVHGATMRDYFARQYGHQGEHEMNRFVTRLANDASRASNADRALYCRATGTIFAGLASATAPALLKVLRDPLLAARHGVASCGAAASPGTVSVRP